MATTPVVVRIDLPFGPDAWPIPIMPPWAVGVAVSQEVAPNAAIPPGACAPGGIVGGAGPATSSYGAGGVAGGVNFAETLNGVGVVTVVSLKFAIAAR